MNWIEDVFHTHAGFLNVTDLASLALTCNVGKESFLPLLSLELWSTACRELMTLSQQAVNCTTRHEMACFAGYMKMTILRPVKLRFFHLQHFDPCTETVALPTGDRDAFRALADRAWEKRTLPPVYWSQAAIELAMMARTLQSRLQADDDSSSFNSSQQLLPVELPARFFKPGTSGQCISSGDASSDVDEFEDVCPVFNSSMQVQVVRKSQQLGLLSSGAAEVFMELTDLAYDCTVPLDTFQHYVERLCAQTQSLGRANLFRIVASMKFYRCGDIGRADETLDKLVLAECDHSAALECVFWTTKATYARIRAFDSWWDKDHAAYIKHLDEMGKHLRAALRTISTTEVDPLIFGRFLFQWSRYLDAHVTFKIYSEEGTKDSFLVGSRDAMERAMVAFHEAGSVAMSQYVAATSDMCRLMGKSVEGLEDSSTCTTDTIRRMRQLQERCSGLDTSDMPVAITARVLMDRMELEMSTPSSHRHVRELEVQCKQLREMRAIISPHLYREVDTLLNGELFRW
eukprot:4527063-Amphidinium_carterae.1